jgi:signal transduction histidine kinase/CheY-like chemotaxis protein
MVILVPDSSWAADIDRLMGTRMARLSWTMVIDSDAPRQAVARARQRFGGQPLAYMATSESGALEAIGSGADESLCFSAYEAQQVLVLLDRTEQRAALRDAADNERTSAVQAEKLAALGTVVAGVAHEINNPLAAVCLSAEYLKNALGPVLDVATEVTRVAAEKRGMTVDELARLATIASKAGRAVEGKRMLDDLLDLVDTIAAIVRDLRIYARSDESETPQLVNVPDLIDQVLRIVGSEITTRANVERDYPEDLPHLIVPRSRIVQVLTNILLNAAHAIQEVERPIHRVRIAVRADDEAVAISITDSGPGIAAEAIERIFDPFYTTKREGRGTGLGLSISRSILLRLGGELVVDSVHGDGATFIAIIPLPERDKLHAALAKSASIAPPPLVSPRRISVLVVDDDERLLRVYPRVLRDHYDVLVAVEGQEAIELISSGVHVDVVMTDLTMPDVNGEQLFRWLETARPDLARRTLFVSGIADAAQHKFLSSVPNIVLEKPVSGVDIFAAIERVMSNEPVSA